MKRTALLLAGAGACGCALGLAPGATAAPVPAGPITFTATDGQLKAGKFPAITTVKPDAPATIRGTVAADGTVTVPSGGISLPTASVQVTQPIPATVTLAFTPTATATGRIDRASGAITSPLRATLDVAVSALGQSCTIRGAQFDLGTGTVQVPSKANPAPPATVPLAGAPLGGDGAFAIAGLSTAALPAAQPASNTVCALVNDQIGLPAVAGVRLAGRIAVSAPKLTAKVATPRATKRGRSVTLKVTVANGGSGDATGVAVKAKLPRGISGTRSVKVGTLAAGKRRTVSLKLRTSSKAAKRSRIALTVSGDGVTSRKATATLKLR